MSLQLRARMTGTGVGIPSRVITNKDLEKMVETNDEWIVTRTGIRERRVIDKNKGETHTSISAQAGLEAIKNAGLKPEDIDYVIACTLTPETFMPMGSARIIDAMGCKQPGSFDLGAACGGFVVGAEVADALIRAGKYKKVLVIGSEVLSEFVDWTDRGTCVIFGDGAGAAVFEATQCDPSIDSCVIDTVTYTWPDTNESLCIPGLASRIPAHDPRYTKNMGFMHMNGQEVFKFASRGMVQAMQELMKRNNVSAEQIKWIVPHQANLRIIEMVAKLMKFPMERTYVNIDRWGNTSAATIPICLGEMNQQGLLKKGDLVMSVTFGGGYSFGAMLARW